MILIQWHSQHAAEALESADELLRYFRVAIRIEERAPELFRDEESIQKLKDSEAVLQCARALMASDCQRQKENSHGRSH